VVTSASRRNGRQRVFNSARTAWSRRSSPTEHRDHVLCLHFSMKLSSCCWRSVVSPPLLMESRRWMPVLQRRSSSGPGSIVLWHAVLTLVSPRHSQPSCPREGVWGGGRGGGGVFLLATLAGCPTLRSGIVPCHDEAGRPWLMIACREVEGEQHRSLLGDAGPRRPYCRRMSRGLRTVCRRLVSRRADASSGPFRDRA